MSCKRVDALLRAINSRVLFMMTFQVTSKATWAGAGVLWGQGFPFVSLVQFGGTQ